MSLKTAAAERRRRYSMRAAAATIPNASAISTCHSHHDACQLRPKAIAIIASARSVKAAATASGIAAGTPAVEGHVAPGRERVQRQADRRQGVERPVSLFRGQRAIEGRQVGERVDGPGAEHPEHQSSQQPLAIHDGRRGSRREVEGGGGGEDACDGEPDRGGDDEAGVRLLEQHAGSRERVEGEEARARDEGEGDEEEAGVVEPSRRLAGEEPQRDADQRRHEDEPEVRRMVLPVDVGVRRGQED